MTLISVLKVFGTGADLALVALAQTQATFQRQYERHEVHLSVRFERAKDFVNEYAENLSRGGLFVSGAHELEPLSAIDVEVDLPGSGTFQVQAKVAHILPPDVAARAGRTPGAGLEIVNRPPGFREALQSYLWQLGRRRDMVVLVDSTRVAELFEEAGYSTQLVPPPSQVLATIARCDKPVVAIVVSDELAADYAPIAARAGGDDMFISYPPRGPIRDLLPQLDARL